MEVEKKSITIYVAGQALKLSIAAEQEETFRKAERNIQAYIKLLEKKGISDAFTCLCYAIVYFAHNDVVKSEKQHFVDNDLVEVLKKIQETVNDALCK